MPLSREGNEILSSFVQQYGRKTGKSYFYAKENKDKKFRRLVRHGKKKRKT